MPIRSELHLLGIKFRSRNLRVGEKIFFPTTDPMLAEMLGHLRMARVFNEDILDFGYVTARHHENGAVTYEFKEDDVTHVRRYYKQEINDLRLTVGDKWVRFFIVWRTARQ